MEELLIDLVNKLNERCVNPEKDVDLLLEEFKTIGVCFVDDNDGERWIFNSQEKQKIAVVSLNVKDFNIWKSEKNFVETKAGTLKRFTVNNNTYFCITNLDDIIGKYFDVMLQTDDAHKNKEYTSIMSLLSYQINY